MKSEFRRKFLNHLKTKDLSYQRQLAGAYDCYAQYGTKVDKSFIRYFKNKENYWYGMEPDSWDEEEQDEIEHDNWYEIKQHNWD